MLNISVLVCQSWQGVHQARINRIIFLTLNIELFDPILAEGQELKLEDISPGPDHAHPPECTPLSRNQSNICFLCH